MKGILISILILSILSLLLTGCSNVVTEEYTEVVATVVDLYYSGSYTAYVQINNMFLPIEDPAQYNVTIAYKDVTETFDNQNLYHSVMIGDKIKVTLYSGYDENDMLVKRKLQLSK